MGQYYKKKKKRESHAYIRNIINFYLYAKDSEFFYNLFGIYGQKKKVRERKWD